MPKPTSRACAPRCRRGQLVEVRSRGEILATLDREGKLEGLPFMREMDQYCGGRFRVLRRVRRVYLDVRYYSARISDTVLLEDVRCDGTAHGGCQMGCLALWKEAWLRPAGEIDQAAASAESGPALPLIEPPSCDESMLSCQAVALAGATQRVPWWDLRQYVGDLFSGERSLPELARMLLRTVCNRSRWSLGLPPLGTLAGTQVQTPTASLGLQPGELVEVRSREEIQGTLDASGRNRGLGFAPDMLRFCGRTYRVARRVERTVLEWSGELRQLRDTVALEGVTCSGIDQHCCPRSCYHLWREIWLRRVVQPAPAGARPALADESSL